MGYFYLTKYVHSQALVEEFGHELSLKHFPETWISDHVDSACIAAGAAAVDFVLGKELVRNVLKNGSTQEKWGAKLVIAYAWAAIVAVVAFINFIYVLIAVPHVQSKLAVKMLATTMLKLGVVETATITAKAVMAARKLAAGKTA